MSDYGIAISSKNADVDKLQDVIYTTKYVTAKLDTNNPVSFSNVRIQFNTDPPEPVAPAIYRETKVFSTPHGYNYIPSNWSLVAVEVPPATGVYQSYYQEDGLVSAQTATDGAYFSVGMDSTNVNFYVRKYNDAGSPNSLVGVALKVRIYVFAEDVGI